MDNTTIIGMMGVAIIVLIGIVLYQQIVLQNGIKKKIQAMGTKLNEILNSDSDEKVMIFTESAVLVELDAQINRVLVDRQKTKAEYRRSQISSKKMLSNISHDIKTPMTVILGYLEIMRLGGQEDKDLLVKVEEKAQKVMEMIDHFFTLAKIEAGDMNIELSRVKVNELCRETILGFYELLTKKKFQVEIVITENPIYVQGNEGALQRVLFNLISNAVHYGDEGGYLGVFLHEEEKYVMIDIVDKGKGIAPDFAEKIFERLYTLEDSRNKEIQGNGLGLTIAKNLATQMDGDILLESEPYVRTIFTVQLKKSL